MVVLVVVVVLSYATGATRGGWSVVAGVAVVAFFVLALIRIVRLAVVAGTDGLVVRNLWRTRFVPWSDVRETVQGPRCGVVLHGGGKVSFDVTKRGRPAGHRRSEEQERVAELVGSWVERHRPPAIP